MAGQTVIDQLIVKLGLDPRDFEKGTKAAAAAVLDAEGKVKQSSEGMGRSFTSAGAKFLTFAAIVATLKKGVGIIDDVAERTRRLGIDSRNYGMAANELRNFENAVEDAGGSAGEARKTIDAFNQSIFDLAYKGQMSDSLGMLARLGVQFQTSTGKAKDFKSVVLDTATAIETVQKSGQMDRNSAFNYLKSSGFDAGTAEMILGGRGAVEAGLDAQGKRRQVSGQDFQKATDIRRASIGKDQAVEGGKIEGMEWLGGLQEGANKIIDTILSPGGVGSSLTHLSNMASKAGDALDSYSIKSAGTTRGLRNNNPLNLRAVGDQRADRQGFRQFPTMEDGITKANAQLDRYAAKGVVKMKDIISTWAPPSENDTAGYIKFIEDETGIKPDDVVDQAHRALLIGAMGKKESGVGAPDSSAVNDILQMQAQGGTLDAMYAEGLPTPGAQASGPVNTTTVDIDQITINTRATDANGIAADIGGSLQRKFTAAHAEQGMN